MKNFQTLPTLQLLPVAQRLRASLPASTASTTQTGGKKNDFTAQWDELTGQAKADFEDAFEDTKPIFF